MAEYRVSVITVVFNTYKAGRKDFFCQMVESVRNQDYKNIEHIVIDGGSTDGSRELLEEMAQKGWIKYISEPDGGIYEAMNKGARMARGELITFLNSDDYFHNPKGLSDAVKVFEQGFDFSYAPVRALDIESGKSKLSKIKLWRVLRNMPFPHPGMLVKKSVFDELQGFDCQYCLLGDYDFILRLMLLGYKGKKSSEYVTFRSGGATDQQAHLHQKEKAAVYYKNYAKLVGLSKEKCEEIAQTYAFPAGLLHKILKGRFSPIIKLSALIMGIKTLKRRFKP